MNAEERKRLRELCEKGPPCYSHGQEYDPPWPSDAVKAELVAAVPELLDDVDRLESENAALKARVEVLEEVRKAAEVVAEDEIGEPGGNPFVCYFCGCHSPSSMAPWRHRDGCPMSALRAALDRAGEP